MSRKQFNTPEGNCSLIGETHLGNELYFPENEKQIIEGLTFM